MKTRKCCECKQPLEEKFYSKSTWAKKETKQVMCSICDSFKYRRSITRYKGVIYIVSHSSFDGYYKVGITTKSVRKRVEGMATLPIGEFKSHFTLESEDIYRDELELHKILDEFRCKGEWFKIDLEALVQISSKWWDSRY